LLLPLRDVLEVLEDESGHSASPAENGEVVFNNICICEPYLASLHHFPYGSERIRTNLLGFVGIDERAQAVTGQSGSPFMNHALASWGSRLTRPNFQRHDKRACHHGRSGICTSGGIQYPAVIQDPRDIRAAEPAPGNSERRVSVELVAKPSRAQFQINQQLYIYPRDLHMHVHHHCGHSSFSISTMPHFSACLAPSAS